MYALVDCNNFFASCERLFRPDLEGKPVVILSNNDGCIVSRSQEAKRLGVLMGQPYFECRELIEREHIHVFSSNFVLYGDISARVMTVLAREVPDIQIYSIDEAFLEISHWSDPVAQARRLIQIVQKEVGIPVSIGIGPTKTMAKLANDYAKKHAPETGGVKDLTKLGQTDLTKLYTQLPVEDIWGVGRESARKLYIKRIKTVADFVAQDESVIKSLLHLPGVRTRAELLGKEVYDFDEHPNAQKSIMSTRSFGRAVTNIGELSEAVASYVARAAEKLRTQKLLVSEITIFIRTNRFRRDDPQYHVSQRLSLDQATDDTITLTNKALTLLRAIYRSQYSYKKAGVILYGLVPESVRQPDLYSNERDIARRRQVMQAMDAVTRRHGRSSLQLAAEGLRKDWWMKSERKSPPYTTHWKSLRKVK